MPDCLIARDLSWIRHFTCGKTSHNFNDVIQAYCGHCHVFMTDVEIERSGDLECDFCSTDPPAWHYPARSFNGEKFGRLQTESTGDWLVCDQCAAFVEQGDREGLLKRSIEIFLRAYPESVKHQAELTRETKKLHDGFFSARTGHVTRFRIQNLTHG